jgi:molybdenum cofactor cytidylyltransferase
MVRAIVLAAGESRRMGRPKAGLPVSPDGPTFAVTLVDALRLSCIADVTVVAGAHPAAVRHALAARPGTRVVDHPGWREGQLSSLRAGLAAVEAPDLEAVIVALVDCPLVRPATIETLVEAWRRTQAPIVRPALGDRHGHPVIFDRVTFADLRTAPLDRGAKAVIEIWRSGLLDLPVDDAGVLADIDTPGDYDAALRTPGR